MKNLIYILLLLAVVSCEKDEIAPSFVPSVIPSPYTITYFVNSDSAYIQYNVMDHNFHHYVSNWDTTFQCFGGWYYNIQVDGYSELISTGVIIDGDTVEGCVGGNLCIMNDYIE